MEENLRGLSFKELFDIFKRIWALLLVVFVLVTTVAQIPSFFRQGEYRAAMTIEIRLRELVELTSADSTLTDSIIETRFNAVTAYFDNAESKIQTARALSHMDITENGLVNGINVSRSRSIISITYYHANSAVAEAVINKFSEICKAKATSADVGFNDIAKTVSKNDTAITSSIVPSVVLGIAAAAGTYAVVLVLYLCTSLMLTRSSVQRIFDADFDGVFSENMDSVRLNELYANIKLGGAAKTIVVAGASEGASGALVLAKAYALNNKKTVVVDCNYVDGDFKQSEGKGIVDATADNYRLLVQHYSDNIDFVPVGTLDSDSVGFVSKQEFSAFIDSLKAVYDVVLISASPLDVYSDALVLIDSLEATLAIAIDLLRAKRMNFDKVKARLQNANVSHVNSLIALNASDYFYAH